MNVARQVGSQDCAVFAIAFMTSLAYDEDATTVKFKQEKMRDHLISCFENNSLTPFPSTKRKVLNNENKTERIDIYCTCRLPSTGSMICCDSCHEWYHQSCIDPAVNIEQVDIEDDWFCANCKKLNT
jgi:hypothetical protein